MPNSIKLLLVDDEVGFVDVLSKRLSKRNMTVTAAYSGTEAIQTLRKQDFDVAVLDLKLELDSESLEFQIPVLIELEPDRISAEGAGQVLDHDQRIAVLRDLVKRGLRAQLKTGNLLSGALFVDLDLYPDESVQTISWQATPPRLPTVPTSLDELRGVLSKLARLPLEQMGNDLSASLVDLRKTMAATNTLLERLDGETTTELNLTLAQMRETLVGAEKLLSPNSPLQAEAYRAIREFAAAARSFRLMADYLERHPEALIRGKGGSAE